MHKDILFKNICYFGKSNIKLQASNYFCLQIQKATKVWIIRNHFNTCLFLSKHIPRQAVNWGLRKIREVWRTTLNNPIRCNNVGTGIQ